MPHITGTSLLEEEVDRLHRRVIELESQQRDDSNTSRRKHFDGQVPDNSILLEGLTRLQREYIIDSDPGQSFGRILDFLLEVTAAEYGFIGEVLHQSAGQPYLKTHAITNIAWDDKTRDFYKQNAPAGLEFYNLDTLFGEVLTTGESVIANDAINDPRGSGLPPGHPPLHAFLGLPFFRAGELVGMVGLANRVGGFDKKLVHALTPFLTTCAGLVHAYHLDLRRKQAEDALKQAHDELERRIQERTRELEEVNKRLGEEAVHRQRAQTSLTQREQLYRNAIAAANSVAYQLEFDSDSYTHIDQRIEDLIGYEVSEVSPRIWRQITTQCDLWGESNALSLAEAKRSFRSGQLDVWRADYECTAKNGHTRWLSDSSVSIRDEQGHVTGCLGILQDITERRQAEESLRVSETRSRTLLEGSPVCTKIIDLDSRLQYMSAAGQRQLKIDDVEAIYGSIFPPKLYPESWRVPVTEHLKRAKAGEICNLECPVLDTEGNEIWFDTTFVPARDEKGRIQYIIVTSVNITERRRAEEEARRRRDELAHVARVSTMGEMATGIAHELNQPLSAIASYSFAAKMIVERFPSGPHELQEILGKLEDQAIRAGDIVRRLRSFVKKTDADRVQADLNAIVRDVAKFVEPDIRQAETRLVLKLADLSLSVVADEIQIQQVLVNLIRNAIDAMQETPASEREVTVSTRILQDGQTEVIVSDAGKGLAQEELEQVFDAFFSTKPEGMGMGLPISRSIVAAHGGKMWSRSNSGPGATFGFTIPQREGSDQ